MSRSLSEIVSLTISGAWRRRHLIVIPILVMPVLGVVASRLAPKAYEFAHDHSGPGARPA